MPISENHDYADDLLQTILDQYRTLQEMLNTADEIESQQIRDHLEIMKTQLQEINEIING